ncbi:MAG: LPS assembly protein LptD [Puniceicoccales bacterium]|jgi:hypothetical protein|nr:LPS assembly protein LptD [Puniceicoccales bacterium]
MTLLKYILNGYGLSMLCFSLPLSAMPLTISSDVPIYYDFDQNVAVAEGNAQAELEGNAYVVADQLSYDGESMRANGNVRFSDELFVIIGDAFGYQFGDKYISGEGLKVGNRQIYGSAEKVDSYVRDGERHTELLNGHIYFGEPGPLTIHVTAKKISFAGNRTLQFTKPTFRIGKFPIATLPSYSQPIYGPPFYLRARYGHRNALGIFAEQKVLFNGNPWVRYGGTLSAYGKRGLLLGPAVELRQMRDGHRMIGKLQSGIINDSGELGKDIFHRPIDKCRYFVDSTFRYNSNGSESVRGELHLWSDPEVKRDFAENEFKKDQFPDHFIEFTSVDNSGLLSVLGRARVNDFEMAVERLPQISYHSISQPLFHGPLYRHGFIEAAHIRRKNNAARPKDEQPFPDSPFFRVDAYQGVELPIRWKSFLTVKPLAGMRVTFYDRDQLDRDYARCLWQVGGDIQINFLGQFDLSVPRWDIQGVRHICIPTLQYRYSPHCDRGRNRIFPIDDTVIGDNLPSIDLWEKRNTDALSSLNVMRIGLQNLFQTQREKMGIQNIMELDLFEDIRFNAETGERRLAELYGSLSLQPAQFCSLKLFNRINTHRKAWEEIRTVFSLHDGNIWHISFSHEYRRKQTDQYGLALHYLFNTRNWIDFMWRYDARLRNLTEQCYRISRQLSSAWVLDARLSIHTHTLHDSKWRFGMGISLNY